MKITKTLTAMAVALAATTGTSAMALDELVVGYFMEWPTANQYAQHNKLYDEARIEGLMYHQPLPLLLL